MPFPQIWFRYNDDPWIGSAPGANPATGAGGIDLSAMVGDRFYLTVQGSGDAGILVNTGNTMFTRLPPAGFTAGLPHMGGGFTTLDPTKVYGSAVLSVGNRFAAFPAAPGMVQSVDGYTTGQYYCELGPPSGDIFSLDWGGGMGADYTAGGVFQNWISNGSFSGGSNLGGALVTGQTLAHELSSIFALGSVVLADAFNFRANSSDIVGLAISVSNPGVVPKLNLDNVIVTSLAAESPCTIAQYTTPPLVAPAVGLRWSDTRGQTFGNAVPRALSTDPLAQLRWNRTGYARDRVFELFWSAAARSALNGAFVIVEPWKS